mmetsp:Transcript_23543/g.79117  ORF Transcript_23543/g.79117 Transcript_23543/m.79117 type:complete len:254 (-) Transcript_23543:1262-2023(-)
MPRRGDGKRRRVKPKPVLLMRTIQRLRQSITGSVATRPSAPPTTASHARRAACPAIVFSIESRRREAPGPARARSFGMPWVKCRCMAGITAPTAVGSVSPGAASLLVDDRLGRPAMSVSTSYRHHPRACMESTLSMPPTKCATTGGLYAQWPSQPATSPSMVPCHELMKVALGAAAVSAPGTGSATDVLGLGPRRSRPTMPPVGGLRGRRMGCHQNRMPSWMRGLPPGLSGTGMKRQQSSISTGERPPEKWRT